MNIAVPKLRVNGNSKNDIDAILKELSDIKFVLDVSSIVAVTDKSGKMTYVNDNFCRISKYTRTELLGQDHRILNSGFHTKVFFKDLWTTIKYGKVWKGEIRNRAKDGAYYWVDTTIIPLLDDKKKPDQYVVIRNLITQRKELEDALKHLPQEIIQAQEREREHISREIHDDLGQSLASLKILIQSSAMEAADDAEEAERAHQKILAYLNTIIDKTRHIASGLRPSTLEVLGLSASIKAMVAEFSADKRMQIDARLGRLDEVVLQGDPINLYRILQEAFTNIVRHAKATKIDVVTRIVQDYLYLSIIDNGRGVQDGGEGRDHYEAGLGLSTMHERTKLLGGELTLNSEAGKGTTIKIKLPVTKQRNTHV